MTFTLLEITGDLSRHAHEPFMSNARQSRGYRDTQWYTDLHQSLDSAQPTRGTPQFVRQCVASLWDSGRTDNRRGGEKKEVVILSAAKDLLTKNR